MQASTTMTCPVCLSANGVQCFEFATPRDSAGFECQACGRFGISRSALVTYFDSRNGTLSALQRAALLHRLSAAHRGSSGLMITTDWMERFELSARLPIPTEQAMNLVRLIGDRLSETGEGYFINDATTPRVWGPSTLECSISKEKNSGPRESSNRSATSRYLTRGGLCAGRPCLRSHA